jgi:C-terminal processing protease CtpA/Prc
MKTHFIFQLLLVVVFTFAFLPSTANAQPPESQKVRNLRAFAKLYGYVRFFHPSDEASQIDWNRFAIYGAQKVKGAKNTQELKSALDALFLPVAPTAQIYPATEKPKPGKLPGDTQGLKIVAWQHRGLGSGASNAIYQSIRLNRKNTQAGRGSDFGTIVQNIDAQTYRGMEIKLMAAVRMETPDDASQGQLWLRVDRTNNQPGFFDNMQDRPFKTAQWQTYEIVGKVDGDASRIAFGGFLLGAGKVWLDKFELFVRNNPSQAWQTVAIPNSGFESGAANSPPESWHAASPGYTFHTTGDKPFEGEKCLLIAKPSVEFSGELFEKRPQIGEAIDQTLDLNLRCYVPLALYSGENGTLGEKNPHAFQKLESTLKSMDLERLTAADENVRVADMVIAWNVLQHFYPYFDVVKVAWDNELTQTLAAALADKTEEDFLLTLRKMVAQLQDGHGNVYHSGIAKRKAGVPFAVDWVESQLVVIALKDTAKIRKGDVILSVGDMPAEKALLHEEQFISGSPQWKRNKALRQFASGDSGSVAMLKVKRGNARLDVAVPRNYKGAPLEEFERAPIQKLEGDIYYVNLDKATIADLNEQITELAQARGVIFDLRGYPKGNHDIIRHLIDQPVQSAKWNVPQIIYPDHQIAGYDTSGRWTLTPKTPRLKGKIVFLTHGGAISYAESFMGIIEHYKLAEIVGQPTAGANGNVNFVELPGGYRVIWTGMKVLKHDGSQHHLIGIKPTTAVARTIQGVRAGKDEFIEKAIAIITR